MQLNTSRIGENLDLFGVDILKRDNVERGAATATSTDGSLWSKATGAIGSEASQIASKATAAVAEATKCSKKNDNNANNGSLSSWVGTEWNDAKCSIKDEINTFQNFIEAEIKDGINSLAQILGVHDFYSAHIMNFCEGYYIPGPMPNDTVKAGEIHKNVTHCSNKTAMYHFDPSSTLANQLNDSTNGLVNLTNVHWPDEVHDGLNALKIAQRAVFVIYCLAICFIFIAMAMAAGSIFTSRRLVAVINFGADFVAFLAIMIGSAIITFIARHATHIINKYGDNIGVSANRGNKFLALTWAATALVFIASLVWIFDFFSGGKFDRSKRGYKGEPKYEMGERYH